MKLISGTAEFLESPVTEMSAFSGDPFETNEKTNSIVDLSFCPSVLMDNFSTFSGTINFRVCSKIPFKRGCIFFLIETELFAPKRLGKRPGPGLGCRTPWTDTDSEFR